MISAPEHHGFDNLSTGGIFFVVGLCFQFFLLHLNPFRGFVFYQSKQKLLWVRGSCFLDHLNPFHGFVFSQSEQKLLNHDLNRSKNCYEFMVRVLWVGSLVFGEVLEGTRVLETRVPCGFS